jgi:copper(I)-binding protein
MRWWNGAIVAAVVGWLGGHTLWSGLPESQHGSKESLQPAGQALRLEGFWARPAGRSIPSAAYGVIRNLGRLPDTLLEASSPQVGRVELHETVRDTGRMRMQRVERIVIPAQDSVVLRPGGLHIMLYELQQPLRPGDTLQLRLRFARAGWQELSCPVGRPARRQAPAPSPDHEGHH